MGHEFNKLIINLLNKPMNKKNRFSQVALVALALTFSLASFAAVAKSDNAKNEKADKGSANKAVSSQKKNEEKTINLKNFEKPDKAKGETNGQVHKEKIRNTVENLNQVATQEKAAGNVKTSNKLQQVIQEQEQTQEQTANAIDQVENRGKIKTFLLGTDYKNLGQLRSSLVHNRNQIRKLTQAMAQVQNEGDKALLQTQLETLMQERERIKDVIATNENSFSLLGWVSRFLNGYSETPIDQQEEDNLTTEVQEAIDSVTENPESTDTAVSSDVTNTTNETNETSSDETTN